MTTTMTALSSASIRHAEFVRLTMTSGTHTFCNAAAAITTSGITFSGLGDLLQLGEIKRDIKATSSDLSISLSGVDGSNVAIILAADIKGSTIEVWRGFLDADNQVSQFFKRYQGIVSNMAITENFDDKLRVRIATCSLSCASFRTVLQNRVGGIKTNSTTWKAKHTSDTSMDRVAAISATFFDFGAEPKTQTQASSTDSVSTQPVDYTGAGS